MFFGIVVIAAVYVLFIYGQASLGGDNNFGRAASLGEENTSSTATNATTAYDEFSCMHDSMYEVLLELQYHLSEIHTQLNEQMANIHTCNSLDMQDEESSENETTTTTSEEEEEHAPADESSHWEYEFAPGKIVPPEPSPSESTA